MDVAAIRWLHLSDLHAGARGKAVLHDVFHALQPDIRQFVSEIGTPDVILFTGDLAYSGTEYDDVDTLLQRIRGWLADAAPGAPQPLLFAVPGNHDVKRPAGFRASRLYSVLDDYANGDDDDVRSVRDELWNQRSAELLEPLFRDYQAWAEKRVIESLRTDPRCQLVHSSYVPGDLTAVIGTDGAHGSFRVGLVGINSAWLQYGSGNYEGKLHIPAEQFHAALPERPADAPESPLAFFERDCDAALLLMHHPPSWLHEQARAGFLSSVYPPERFSLCLYGHLHAARSEVTAISGPAARVYFQAPSLFGLERYGTSQERRVFGYTWGELRADGGLRLWPRELVTRDNGRQVFDRDRRFDVSADGSTWLRMPASGVAVTSPRPPQSQPPDYHAALRRYARWARKTHAGLDMAGLGGGHLRLDLDDIYVPLRLNARGAGCDEPDDLKSMKAGRHGLHGGVQRVELTEAFRRVGGARHLFILGDPGSGKTTALRKLLWSCLARSPGVDDDRGGFAGAALGLAADTVPVFVRLRDLDAEALDAPLADFLDAQLAEQVGRLPAGTGAWLWRRGHLLLLLDGLDEIARSDMRERVCRYIEDNLRTAEKAGIAGIRAVVSSRFAGLGGRIGFDNDFARLDIQPMSDDQIEQLVTRWFVAAECAMARMNREDDLIARERGMTRGRELAKNLRSAEFSSPQLLELVSNPLLLTLLCVVVFGGRQIPRDRVAFFEDCLRTLLGRWRRGFAEAGPPLLPVRDALGVLQPVAWHMHCGGRKYDLGRDELHTVMEPELAALARRLGPLSFEDVLDWLRRDAGVLNEYAPGEFGFMHLSLQEYLAATYAAVHAEEGLVRLAAEFGNQWWREVTLLFVALGEHRHFGTLMRWVLASDALTGQEGLIRACLNQAHRPDTGPFAEIIEDGRQSLARRQAAMRLVLHQADERVRAAAVGLVGNGSEAVDREERVRVEERTGMRFLWIPGGEFSMGAADISEEEQPVHLVRVSPFWLAEVPVTNRQYGMFLAATRRGEPRYWRDRRFNQPDQPVVGVSWLDAGAFCAWLSAANGGVFDLPSETQWEFAARGPENRLFPWGDEVPNESRAHFGQDWDADAPLPVGSLLAGRGPFGTLDQAGNVWEWCRDRFDKAAYRNRAVPAVDPLVLGEDADPAEGRAVRGGSWHNPAQSLRSAGRSRDRAHVSGSDLGFRVSSSPAAGEWGASLSTGDVSDT